MKIYNYNAALGQYLVEHSGHDCGQEFRGKYVVESRYIYRRTRRKQWTFGMCDHKEPFSSLEEAELVMAEYWDAVTKNSDKAKLRRQIEDKLRKDSEFLAMVASIM